MLSNNRSILLAAAFAAAVWISLFVAPGESAASQCGVSWPDQSSRHLSSNDLSACSCAELRILRNEIYARHGRIFKSKDLQQHFQAQPWYYPDPNNSDGTKGQNSYEKKNAVFIQNLEKSWGCKGGGGSSSPPPSSSGACPSWPAQSTRNISAGELSSCSCYELRILRNEIYARHGRIFKSKDLQQYFQSQPWYYPDANNSGGTKGQNSYEKRNATAILNHEKSRGCSGGGSSSSPPPPPPPSSGYCPSWPAQRNYNISNSELANCSCGELRILRNEIYARHGRIFKSKDLQQYFGAQPWYYPDPNNSDGTRGQNSYEKRNANSILNYEKSRGCR